MNALDVGLIAVGALAAGAANSLAGGGSFFSFPALLAVGVPPVMANASNSVAMWPGSVAGACAYRHELGGFKRWVLPMGLASLVGGAAGGLLLLVTGDAQFGRLIPWLLAFATLLFAFSPQLSQWVKRRRPAPASHSEAPSDLGRMAQHPRGSPWAWAAQLLVSVYGGFFGAGMGILMMASLAIGGLTNVQHINALKNLFSVAVYSVTMLTFVLAGSVSWPHTSVMLVTATLGGYLGARLARRMQGTWLRRVVIAVGVALTAYYFMQTPGVSLA